MLKAEALPSRKCYCPGCCHLHAHVRFIQEPRIVPGKLWGTLASGRPGVWGDLAPYLTSEEWVWDLTAACVVVLGAGAAG